MYDVYLCGHGHWRTIGQDEPFTMVPKGTKFTVYTPVGGYLDPGNAYATMSGDTTLGGMIFSPYQTFEEFRTCPNTTLLPLIQGHDDDSIASFNSAATQGKHIHRVNAATTLKTLLEHFKGYHVHWMACRPRLGDRSVEQGGFNDDYIPAWGMYGRIPNHLINK